MCDDDENKLIFFVHGATFDMHVCRYIFEGEGSDQVLGRVCCGLDYFTLDFVTLPPRFLTTDVLSEDEWLQAVPMYKCYPSGFRQVIQYFVASVVYHQEFLTAKLPHNHRLFQTPFWTNELHLKLKPSIITGEGIDSGCKMRATGVPRDHITSVEVRRLGRVVDELEKKLTASTNGIMEELPSTIVNRILENMEINGAVAVTRSDITGMMQQLRDDIRQDFGAPAVAAAPPAAPAPPSNTSVWASFMWGNPRIIQPVPHDFRLPRANVKTMFYLWYNGHASLRYSPYRQFISRNMTCSADKSALLKLRGVMKALESVMVSKQLMTTPDSLMAQTATQQGSAFDAAYGEMMRDHKGNVGNLKYMTVYKYLQNVNVIAGALAGQNDEEEHEEEHEDEEEEEHENSGVA